MEDECGHCKRLAPAWDQLANAFKANTEVEVMAVDCTKNKDLCTNYKIPGFPTLKLFFKGEEKEQYRGSRDITSLEKWLTAQSDALLATVDDA
ncbi:hypothetical protein H632_c3327p0 [Helicosporidium sp. ATCC 50920]|nr:hypothetical protein H632_c3327p0 [Helicosporidium sp. ATCC 50920]|eukprot:KDD72451.1 hypothetical protein H632_c3327p0 [Helicosporidium sp. ATCC 50920]